MSDTTKLEEARELIRELANELTNEGLHNLDCVERDILFLNQRFPTPKLVKVKTTDIRKILPDTLALDIALKDWFHVMDYPIVYAGRAKVLITELFEKHVVILDGSFANVEPNLNVNWEQIAGFLNNKYSN